MFAAAASPPHPLQIPPSSMVAAKTDRLKQAKDEAEREIAAFKAEREAEFKGKVRAVGGRLGGAVQAALLVVDGWAAACALAVHIVSSASVAPCAESADSFVCCAPAPRCNARSRTTAAAQTPTSRAWQMSRHARSRASRTACSRRRRMWVSIVPLGVLPVGKVHVLLTQVTASRLCLHVVTRAAAALPAKLSTVCLTYATLRCCLFSASGAGPAAAPRDDGDGCQGLSSRVIHGGGPAQHHAAAAARKSLGDAAACSQEFWGPQRSSWRCGMPGHLEAQPLLQCTCKHAPSPPATAGAFLHHTPSPRCIHFVCH